MRENPGVTGLHDKHGVERSPRWPATRRRYLRAHGICAVCARTTWLQVHHVLPVHLCAVVAERRDLELDARNLITLCEPPGKEGCHNRVGHLGDYRTYNPRVRYKRVPARKPPVLEKMTPRDRRNFRRLVVRRYGSRT